MKRTSALVLVPSISMLFASALAPSALAVPPEARTPFLASHRFDLRVHVAARHGAVADDAWLAERVAAANAAFAVTRVQFVMVEHRTSEGLGSVHRPWAPRVFDLLSVPTGSQRGAITVVVFGPPEVDGSDEAAADECVFASLRGRLVAPIVAGASVLALTHSLAHLFVGSGHEAVSPLDPAAPTLPFTVAQQHAIAASAPQMAAALDRTLSPDAPPQVHLLE